MHRHIVRAPSDGGVPNKEHAVAHHVRVHRISRGGRYPVEHHVQILDALLWDAGEGEARPVDGVAKPRCDLRRAEDGHAAGGDRPREPHAPAHAERREAELRIGPVGAVRL